MQVVFKILQFLCLSSVTFSLQLIPSLNIKTPIGLEIGLGGGNTEIFNNINSKSNNPTPDNQCFCYPNNADSIPVISYFDPRNNDLERKVVYLYKSDGEIKVYIPNKKKQDLIPELNFDGNDGDILIPVTSESISELFNKNIVEPQQTILTFPDGIINEGEMVGVETHQPQLINTNTDSQKQIGEESSYLSIIPSDGNNLPLDDMTYNQNLLSDSLLKPSNQVEIEAVSISDPNQITFLDDTNNLQEIISISPSELQATSSQDIAVDNNNNKQTNYDNINQFHQVGSILPSEPVAVSHISPINDDKNQITNFDIVDHLHQHDSMLPIKSHSMGIQIAPINNDNNQNINFNEIDPIQQFDSNLSKPQAVGNQIVSNINNNKNLVSNIDNIDQLHQTASMIPSEETTNNQDTDILPGSDNLDQLGLITTLLPYKPLHSSVSHGNVNIPSLSDNQNLDDPGHSHQIFSISPLKSQTQGIKGPGWFEKATNLDNFHRPILTFLPPKSQSHGESPLPQNPFIADSAANRYFTFYQWFEDQLTRVLILNLETPSKIKALRERIIKVLQDNGMRIGVKGIVIDSNGNLVQMNKIKLRPILIGNHVDAEDVLNQQTKLSETAVSYLQLIEIILVEPPKLLATLVMGTVYLPRNVNGARIVNIWGKHKDDLIVPIKHPLGCITCKSRHPNSNSHSSVNKIRHPPIAVPYGQYFGLPFRRTFNNEKQVLLEELQSKGGTTSNTEPQRRIGDEARSNNGIGGIFVGLLENLGISPTLLTNPSRRLLGGRIPNGPKPGPKKYPNDFLPGYRIIGGNAATSSGTPLVSKGRSGFEKPSLII